jgi:hypothetical protein
MKIHMAYILIILVTLLMAVPRILFRSQPGGEGYQPRTELNIGFASNSFSRERPAEIILEDSSSPQESQLELESWMKDLREWDLSKSNEPENLDGPSKKMMGNDRVNAGNGLTLSNN